MGKIKSFIESEAGKDVLVLLIVILVGLGSFLLGRLSSASNTGGLRVEYPNNIQSFQALNQPASAISALETSTLENSTNSSGKAFFASNRGSKYYPLGCAGGKSIKQENRVYFSTREQAEAAGYELSSTCK